jgi:hypothetical protein
MVWVRVKYNENIVDRDQREIRMRTSDKEARPVAVLEYRRQRAFNFQ